MYGKRGGIGNLELDGKRSLSPSFILTDGAGDRYMHGLCPKGHHCSHLRGWQDAYWTGFIDLQLSGALPSDCRCNQAIYTHNAIIPAKATRNGRKFTRTAFFRVFEKRLENKRNQVLPVPCLFSGKGRGDRSGEIVTRHTRVLSGTMNLVSAQRTALALCFVPPSLHPFTFVGVLAVDSAEMPAVVGLPVLPDEPPSASLASAHPRHVF